MTCKILHQNNFIDFSTDYFLIVSINFCLNEIQIISQWSSYNISINKKHRCKRTINQAKNTLSIIWNYFRDEFATLDIPFKYRDYCQDDYADYISCVRTHPKALANNLIYLLPFSEYYSFCKPLLNQWEKCQTFREK